MEGRIEERNEVRRYSLGERSIDTLLDFYPYELV
jgi:hypothetical protein